MKKSHAITFDVKSDATQFAWNWIDLLKINFYVWNTFDELLFLLYSHTHTHTILLSSYSKYSDTFIELPEKCCVSTIVVRSVRGTICFCIPIKKKNNQCSCSRLCLKILCWWSAREFGRFESWTSYMPTSVSVVVVVGSGYCHILEIFISRE